MASTYSTNLKIELQATGENSGTWGTITNTNLGTALEQAIVGYGNPSYASDANLTLTYTDTNAAQAARALVLNVTSAVSLTATRELVVPTIQKQYIVQNNTTGSQSITVKTSAGTGITVPNGRKAHLYVDGTNVIYMDDYVDINGGAIDGTPIGANSASTGAFTTLSASGNFTLSGGTANGVLYLNGSKAATSGSALVFDGTNLGLGVTPSAWYSTWKSVDVASGGSSLFGSGAIGGVSVNAFLDGSLNWIYKSSFAAGRYQISSDGSHAWYTASSGTAGNIISFTTAMVLDASGNLVIGKTSTNLPGKLDVQADTNSGGVSYVRFQNGASTNAAGTAISIMLGDTADNRAEIRGVTSDASNGFLSFWTQGSGTRAERARITAGGDFLVSKTTTGLDIDPGLEVLSTGRTSPIVDGGVCMYVSRLTNDGDLIIFRQAGADEGSISVSGNTVSYNAFAGSHWSQLQDGSKPDILRGTVMESINELCVWPGENNERLPKAKISNTAGSKKVYGVFMAWDNDWTTTNDMYVTAVGAFICRVNGSVTVQEGDLLESNGDGTARVQADDIIRSSTIGKVTSTVKTHEYDDGSYCVPTVLYCG